MRASATTNNALKYLRRRKNSKTVPLAEAGKHGGPRPEADAPAESPLEKQEALAQAWERIQHLPDQQRWVFVLRTVEGWAFDNIATELNISPGTARSYYFSAVKHLQQLAE